MSLFIAIRAFATPQQIIPNREVVALEEIGRQLRVMNEQGIKLRSDQPLRMKIEDEVTMVVGGKGRARAYVRRTGSAGLANEGRDGALARALRNARFG